MKAQDIPCVSCLLYGLRQWLELAALYTGLIPGRDETLRYLQHRISRLQWNLQRGAWRVAMALLLVTGAMALLYGNIVAEKLGDKFPWTTSTGSDVVVTALVWMLLLLFVWI